MSKPSEDARLSFEQALAELEKIVAGMESGELSLEQWRVLSECAVVARVVVPNLRGDAWVYFARLYALAQAMLRGAPDLPADY